jgi:hypothetical protein
MDIGYMRVKPREGLTVQFPRTYSVLPEEGAVVPCIGPDGRYWRRRVATGDVLVVTDAEQKVEEKKIRKVEEAK